MNTPSAARKARAAVGCALILATGFGAFSTISASAPLIADGLNTSIVEYSVGPMIATITAFVGSLIASRVIDIITPRRCLFIGTVLVTVSMAAISVTHNLFVWYAVNLLNGIMLAIGTHASVAGILAEFYGTRASSVFGIVVGAMAFIVAGEVFAESIALNYVDYRGFMMAFSVFALVVGLFSNLVLIGRKVTPTASLPEEAADLDSDGGSAMDTGVTLKQALRNPAVYLFFLAMCLAAFPYQGYASYAAYYYVDAGLTASAATGLLSAFELITAALSLGVGIAARKWGASPVGAILFVGFACGIALLLGWRVWGNMSMLYGSVVLCSLCGLVQTLPAIFASEMFGMRDYTAFNAIGNAGMNGGSAALFMVISFAIEGVGYDAAFAMLGVLGILSLVLFLGGMLLRPFGRRKVTHLVAKAEKVGA